ncbi:MAG: glycoside hydrolase family 6 protein [Microbacteriaceae bacterium]|nr:glycoside hydrolase family 6 protein [Microbacteriaceae bacterium]
MPAPTTTAPVAAPAPDPGYGLPLDVNPASAPAAMLADPATALSDEDRALVERIASQPLATWIAGPTSGVQEQVSGVVTAAAERGGIPVLVAYGIPHRDCGGHSSAGPVSDAAGYLEWIDAFASGLRGERAIVVLEPDAIAQMDCLEQPQRTERLDLLAAAVGRLTAAGADVYIDAGHSGWKQMDVIAGRLERAGVAQAAGFSLNVSNFRGTEEQIAYGREVAKLLPGEPHIVIDTSRNGWPSDSGDWCNPWDRALGTPPTVETGDDFVDAFLWIKTPGQSDGECNGGPPAGQWWQDYALMLARNAAG